MPDPQMILDVLLRPEVALPVLLGGMLIAFWIGRRTSEATVRVAELEGALADARTERAKASDALGDYQGRVTDHFTETSRKLHELTLQYRAVYDHLAEGANQLCPDGFEKLEGGLGLDSLPEESLTRPADDLAPELETDLDDATPQPLDPPADVSASELGSDAERAADEAPRTG